MRGLARHHRAQEVRGGAQGEREEVPVAHPDAIVSGTIDLAHALGLKVVAEGVETAEQLARLEELGCDLAQGFFLSEPLSVGEASELLKRNDSP